jgi:IS30 family transposase
MSKEEWPPMMHDGRITKGDAISSDLSIIFPSWSSTRISRWLGVNVRTIQRWLKSGRGEFVDEQIPSDVAGKIYSLARQIEDQDLGAELDRWIKMQVEDNRIPKEVLAAWLADRYLKLIGREID